MDSTELETDGLVSKLQSELTRLKEVFQSSTDSQNWAKSERVCRCSDEEFSSLLQSLSANELMAAAHILQRHVDLEQQISKCLDNLKGVQSGNDKKSIDVMQKLITSQSKLARLRSRLLRCVTQQLQKKSSFKSPLPPWSGLKLENTGKLSGNKAVTPPEQDKQEDRERDSCNVDPSTSGETVKEASTSVYETIYPSATVSSNEMKAQDTSEDMVKTGTSPPTQEAQYEILDTSTSLGTTAAAVGAGGKLGVKPMEVPKNKCCSLPPKPLPYSSPKKTNFFVDDGVRDQQAKKEDVKTAPIYTDYEDVDALISTEHQQLLDWDPTPVLKELYGNVRPLPVPSQESTQVSFNNIRMAGYMVKLPVKNSQKKASVFKGWKQRHFKAVNGKLYYYRDHRALQPLGFIDLIGCQVKRVDDKILEVVEMSGRSLTLKCAFVKEAEDWKEALEAEAAASVEVATVNKDSDLEGLVIIIDLGSSSIKAGFALEDAWPQVMFPCVIAVDKQNTDNCKFGFDALVPAARKNSTLKFPLRKSLKIDKLKFDTGDLIGILEHVFDQLKVDPAKHKVIMTLPYGAGPQEKEEIVEILLDQFQVEACYLQEQAILAMYSYSAISGIVVDIGNHIDIFPVVEGCIIESGTTRLPYGGRQITDSFTRLLTEKGLRLFSEVESYVSQAVKEKVSFVTKYGAHDEDITDGSALVVDLEKYSLPDGTRNVTVDTARFRCTEGLFKPSVWGRDNPGIHELTVKAIMASGIDMRKQMCRNVYLSGGGSMSSGLAERLQAEISTLMPSSAHVQVHAGLERYHAAYIGAAVVARLPLFEELCVSKEDWDNLGPEALVKWSSM